MARRKKSPPLKFLSLVFLNRPPKQTPPPPPCTHGEAWALCSPFQAFQAPPTPNPIAGQRHSDKKTSLILCPEVRSRKIPPNTSQTQNPKPSFDLFFILYLLSSRSTAAPASLDWHCLWCRGSCAVLYLFHCPSPYETSCLSPIPCQLSILSNPISVRTHSHLQFPARRHLSTILLISGKIKTRPVRSVSKKHSSTS
jgi:hypothetical protein